MEPENRRDKIALYLIGFSFAAIVAISYFYLQYNGTAEGTQNLFNALLPLISTWIGTVLVFYFGKENFEAASKRYEQIISRLTPDLLDDILVKQVMIDIYTMVSVDVANPMVSTLNVSGLVDFLNGIKKSRLPILTGKTPTYIIHKDILNQELLKAGTPQAAATIAAMATTYPVIAEFGIVKDTDKVEVALKLMKENRYKDIFVLNAAGEIVGWLTDTHIIRYMDDKAS